jgi:hypothetical protein
MSEKETGPVVHATEPAGITQDAAPSTENLGARLDPKAGVAGADAATRDTGAEADAERPRIKRKRATAQTELDRCGCTILSTHLRGGFGPLCVKRFDRDENGKVQKHDYDDAFKFAFERRRFARLDGLFKLLERLQGEPRRFIVRAEPIAGIGEGPHRRLLHPDSKTGDPATLQRKDRYWINIDVDGIPCPPGIDPTKDPEAAAEYVASEVARHAPEFRDKSYIFQWSSSQSVEGIKEGTLSCHLYFWLDRAINDDVLRRWATWLKAKAGFPIVDPRVFVSVQPNYTGSPIFEGVADPLPRRLGLRRKSSDAVALVLPPEDEAKSSKPRKPRAEKQEREAPSETAGQEEAYETRPEIAAHPRVRGYVAKAVRDEVQNVEQEKPEKEGGIGRNNRLNDSALKIGHYVRDGGLKPKDITEKLYAAAVVNKLVKDTSEKAVRATIASGLKAGMAEPTDLSWLCAEANATGDDEKMSLRDQLLAIGLAAELWRNERGEPYATVQRNGHAEHYAVDSGAFKNWLIHTFMAKQTRVRAPTGNAVKEAIAAISAQASCGPTHRTFVRVGEHDGKVYLDLCNEQWEAIEFDASGWRVVADCPVKMLRYAGTEPLPYPVRDGSIEVLRQYVNGDDDTFKLIVADCVALLFPTGPFPILDLAGEQGSTKSTLTRVIKRTIDPNRVPLRSKPKSEDDLLIAAERNHVLAFDNFSSISEELADMLCRLATGGGISKRTLYTNKDETLLGACKPVIVNGIPELITRDDLADRAISRVLLPFTGRRRDEKELHAEIDNVSRPIILGALLEGAVRAIRRAHEIVLPEDAPRMADFAKRAIAAFPAFGWAEGEFMRIWRAYRATVAEKAVEHNVIACAIQNLMGKAVNGVWEGDAGELLNDLAACVDWRARQDKTQWPTLPHHLVNRVRRAAGMLRATGIDVDLEGKDPKTRRRVIRITKRRISGFTKRAEGRP